MDATIVLRAALARMGVRPSPISVGFEMTHLCNLECHYCDRHTPLPNEMSFSQIKTALSGLHELGMQHISLDGGEPMAHKHVDEIVAWLVDSKVRVFMNTNGILIPRKLDTVRKLSKVKISLDGPRENHDRMRGKAAFDKAVRGAEAAREVGVEVEFTCVVGKHNVDALDELVEEGIRLGMPIIFQPARNSLFLGTDRDGSDFQLDEPEIRRAFLRLAWHKKRTNIIGNRWSSLRHFMGFPNDQTIPCAAGWINVTMDPEGNLFNCGQVNRNGNPPNVTRMSVRDAFLSLQREGCSQCWCARVVEENQLWGGRIDKMLPFAGSESPIAATPKRRLHIMG